MGWCVGSMVGAAASQCPGFGPGSFLYGVYTLSLGLCGGPSLLPQSKSLPGRLIGESKIAL